MHYRLAEQGQRVLSPVRNVSRMLSAIASEVAAQAHLNPGGCHALQDGLKLLLLTEAVSGATYEEHGLLEIYKRAVSQLLLRTLTERSTGGLLARRGMLCSP